VARLPVATPDRIDWKRFLRIAAPMSGLVGILTVYVPLAWLVLFPGSVFLAVHVYRRHRPGPLKTAQGARLGTLVGVLTFAVVALFLVAAVVHDPSGYRQQMESGLRDALARNPNPQADQAVQMFSGARGIAFLTVFGMSLLLVFTLIIGGVSGALAASLGRNRPGP
jgi:hypothetical protein